MRVAIIGARRSRNGIGEYIAKYFHNNGATVVSVLGTTRGTAQDASWALRRYGIDSVPHVDFYEMVAKEGPDAAVIASPSRTHYEYLVKCIDVGLNVLCEKPFIWQEANDVRQATEGILERASRRNLTIAMNSQWPFSLRYYEELCGPIDSGKTGTFSVNMSPISLGKEMIPESVPHPLSLLYYVLGDGEIEDLCFDSYDDGMTIAFRYLSEWSDCGVSIDLVRKGHQPRDFCFGFNERMVRRILDFEKYGIYFSHEDEKMKIIDPLELSIRDFIGAVKGQREPIIGSSHIVSTISLLRRIYDSYPDI